MCSNTYLKKSKICKVYKNIFYLKGTIKLRIVFLWAQKLTIINFCKHFCKVTTLNHRFIYTKPLGKKKQRITNNNQSKVMNLIFFLIFWFRIFK